MKKLIFTLTSLCLTLVLAVNAQSQNKTLSLEDYTQWSSIGSTSLSDDGEWMSYSYSPNEGDDTLYFKNIESNLLYDEPLGSNPQFSDNNKWASFFMNLSEKETKKLKKSKKPINKKAVLLNLQDGSKKIWEKASRFSFSPKSNFLLISKPEGSKSHKGKDLIIYSLEEEWTINLGNVSEYLFNQQGSHLAYLVDAADKAGNGIYLLKLDSRSITPIETDSMSYSKLSWDENMLYESEKGTKGSTLIALKGFKVDSLQQSANQIVLVSNITKEPSSRIIKPSEISGFPEGYVISDLGSVRFSLDNNSLTIPIKEQSEKAKVSKDTVANVDVWHWDDEQIQSVQMKRAARERRKTFNALLNLNSGKFLQLTSEDLRSVSLNRNFDKALASDPTPYIDDTNWGGGYSDYYQLDIETGQKELIEKKIGRGMGLSPNGEHFLFFKDENFFVYNMENGGKTNITQNVDVSFFNTEEDHPYENPSYGIAGWTSDGKGVIINHKFDVWNVTLDGTGGENITGNYGSEQEIRFRINSLTREPGIDLSKDVYLTGYGEWTKKSGFFLLKEGKAPKELLFDDASYGRLKKAKEGETVLLTKQSFVDFPDYYTTNLKFKTLTKQTYANPQQSDFLWGKRVLVDFKNSHGDKLQGTLTLPGDYQEGKKYPMIVYFYEKMSQRHHSYSMPTYDDRPHMSTYASNGYLVFMPDIKYYEGEPGTNAVDCVTSAVQKVIDLGYADPDNIGLQGHSWGGYQSSYILTQSDMFACVVTGAPVTNLTSMYNILYKNSGSNNHGIMEMGQVRMGKGMFDDMDNYIAQSPVQQAAGISTPFMILHGTVDGAVDWNQGLELYNAARRLGKEVILLSYPNENHHLANLNNQKDFQIRMKQYFDHHLKGDVVPEWMKSGVKFVDKLYENAK